MGRSHQKQPRVPATLRPTHGHRNTGLARHLSQSAPITTALAGALARNTDASVRGSRGSAATLLAGAVALQLRRPVLLVVAHLDEADDALDDLERFSHQGLKTQRFGALEVLPGESAVNLELLAERLAVVAQWATPQTNHTPKPQGATVLVAPIQALMQGVPQPDALGEFTLTLEPDTDMPPGRLLDWLDRAGYQREDAVAQPGDFAVRGGIIDLFPVGGSMFAFDASPAPLTPIRLDFFGDEIESIHAIDPEALGSKHRLSRVSLVGGSALQLQTDHQRANLLDLLPDEVIPILHETLELSEQARGYYERLTNPAGIDPPATVFKKLTQRTHAEINGYSAGSAQGEQLQLPVTPLPLFDTDAKSAITELGELATDETNRVVMLCANQSEQSRLRELLLEFAPQSIDRITLEIGTIHRGFSLSLKSENKNQTSQILLIPHHELFHRYETRRRVRKVFGKTSAGGDAFFDLDVGDYVVHVDHGIAKFTGLKTITPRPRPRKGASGSVSKKKSGGASGGEYLSLVFAAGAIMHVPATQIDLIQKYVGGFEGRPPLSRLGGKKWKGQKQQVGEAVKELAKELLQVQAARETQPGIRYPADTPWMKEFEAEFPYDETEDQLSAIAAVKRDMSEPTPMDRLICGDVGFGKTEVAIRAAFKAVEFGKQVAVLVPTTVLAEQHERTFGARFADYPFKIASLSRFKTGKEARQVLDEVAAGRVDVLIGTHRLLSKDVKFADLGLVVIDEEQRFGVEHKNKLLSFRLTADVLTLTATPIPRTLHMSMVGLRNISSLTTPPVDRRAIVTEVVPYAEQRIQQALIRELSRNGQVFFVHNRVHNLQTVADDLQRLVPDARIAIGHGQMPPRMLEAVMRRFMRREVDVFVSTTIIESGIDIPTANTMFINQADHFGLSELHQLRGRVGRSKHRAYCYLLLPPDRSVTEVATKRLRAIEGYSMLGAGFKIAMRDLEIRGAGNLLGAEQSGHIAAVGYELYCVLLERETKRLKNEPLTDVARTHLELPITGTLPKRYIPSGKHRMDAYRRLTRVNTLAEFDAVIDDLKDSYGDPPTAAQIFLSVTEVRIAAAMLGMTKVQLEGPDLIFLADEPAKILRLFEGAPGRASLLEDGTVYYRPPSAYVEDPATLLAVLRKLLVRPVRGGVESAKVKSEK